jgi:hypothetical protein
MGALHRCTACHGQAVLSRGTIGEPAVNEPDPVVVLPGLGIHAYATTAVGPSPTTAVTINWRAL